MPFKKVRSGPDKGKYVSPSGRKFTGRQVRYYYANNGFGKKKKRRPAMGTGGMGG